MNIETHIKLDSKSLPEHKSKFERASLATKNELVNEIMNKNLHFKECFLYSNIFKTFLYIYNSQRSGFYVSKWK